MKVSDASPFRAIVFKNENTYAKSEQSKVPQPDKNFNNKKLLYAALGALAIAGSAGLIINNIRKGKAKALAQAKAQAEALAKAEQIAVEKEQAYFDKTYNSVNKNAKESAEVFDTYLNNKEYVSNLKQYLRTKTPMNSESIDARLKPEVKEGAWSKKDMKTYYESDCVQVDKSNLSTSYKNFSADEKLVKEKRIYTASSEYGEGATEIINTNKNGTKISEIKTPDGKLIESSIYRPYSEFKVKKYFENGKLSKIVSKDKNGETKTIFADSIKTSMYKNNDGTQVFKIYEQDKNGKYHCIRREIISAYNTTLKDVEYINDGKYSKTTSRNIEYAQGDESIKTVIRDRKGNIIDESKINVPKSGKSKPSKGTSGAAGAKGADGAQGTEDLLASWYKDYLKLCKEYGVSPRPCGVKGGAGDHWFELCMRRNDPVAYEDYLKLQAHRARYNEDAMFMQILRMADDKSVNLSLEKLSKLSKDELKNLFKAIENDDIEVKDLENLSFEKLGERIKTMNKTKKVYHIKQKRPIILNDLNNTLIISHGNPYKSSYKQTHKEKEVTVCK